MLVAFARLTELITGLYKDFDGNTAHNSIVGFLLEQGYDSLRGVAERVRKRFSKIQNRFPQKSLVLS